MHYLGGYTFQIFHMGPHLKLKQVGFSMIKMTEVKRENYSC
jgi:hypothetical protein